MTCSSGPSSFAPPPLNPPPPPSQPRFSESHARPRARPPGRDEGMEGTGLMWGGTLRRRVRPFTLSHTRAATRHVTTSSQMTYHRCRLDTHPEHIYTLFTPTSVPRVHLGTGKEAIKRRAGSEGSADGMIAAPASPPLSPPLSGLMTHVCAFRVARRAWRTHAHGICSWYRGSPVLSTFEPIRDFLRENVASDSGLLGFLF